MRPIQFAIFMLALVFSAALRASEEPGQAPLRPNAEQLREQLKGLAPAERETKLKELREKYTKTAPDREPIKKRREEMKKERQAKALRALTSEERAAKRKELRTRLQDELNTLRTNKLEGKLSPADEKRLRLMEEVAKRFDAE